MKLLSIIRFFFFTTRFTVIRRYYWFSIYRKNTLIFLLSSCQIGLQVKNVRHSPRRTRPVLPAQENRKQVVRHTGLVGFRAQCVGRVTVQRVLLRRC